MAFNKNQHFVLSVRRARGGRFIVTIVDSGPGPEW